MKIEENIKRWMQPARKKEKFFKPKTNLAVRWHKEQRRDKGGVKNSHD